jgi:hypothetical protein
MVAVIKTKSSLTSNVVNRLGVGRACSHKRNFGLNMVDHPIGLREGRVFLRLAPAIGLFAALLPAAAHAQVNIDQGKSAAQIFANDCAACHKATRGLANGRNSLTLSSFLREHYTASREQAAALAAYVLGAGGAESAPKPGQKPTADHAKVEEPKTAEPKAGEGRATEAKTAARPAQETAKPEGETPAAVRLQSPEGEEAKPEEPANPGAVAIPAQRPVAGARGRVAHPVTATRGGANGPEPPLSPEESVTAPAVAAAPSANDQPASAPAAAMPETDVGSTSGAAAPAELPPGEDTPVPRDNIPD